MKVAVLGAGGVIGRHLSISLASRHVVTPVAHSDLNLLDTAAAFNFFATHQFDVVVNAAGNTNSNIAAPFDPAIIDTNVGIMQTLSVSQRNFRKLITFGSGAEFDRSYHISNAKESDLYSARPFDAYGMSKNIASRLAMDIPNCCTLRLFGVFDPSEKSTRLFPKILSKTPIILEDKFFDYVSLTDLAIVVQHFVENTPPYKDMNVVYSRKQSLSETVRMFCRLHDISLDLIQFEEIRGWSYTGDGSRLEKLNLPLNGLEEGLRKYT